MNAIETILAELTGFDTCTIADAVDSFRARLMNEGFVGSSIACRTGFPLPMVGHALTMKVRSSDPPMKKDFYMHSEDWWEHLPAEPFRRVLVIEDVDVRPGRGAMVGPAHACILRAMGFTGVVSTGAVRGVARFSEIGLHAFSAYLSPAHSYRHVVSVGEPVLVDGVRIETGDVIHGDAGGIVSIPAGLLPDMPAAARRARDRERGVCEVAGAGVFSPDLVRRAISDGGHR